MIGVLKRKRCLFDWKVSNSSCNRAPAWAEVSSSFKIQTTSRKSISRGRNSLWTLSPITANYGTFQLFRDIFFNYSIKIQSTRELQIVSGGETKTTRCAAAI